MKNLGTYPDGSAIYDDIHNNGPIVAADLQKEAVIHFFETMSHGNIDVTFDIPRNPRDTNGMWYTEKNYSQYSSSRYAQESILDSVYYFYPDLINNANYLYFYEPHIAQAHTWVGERKLTNGTTVYYGAMAESPNNIFWPQIMWVISHEIAHQIGYAVGASSDWPTLPDRGTDRTSYIERPGYSPVFPHVMTGTYDLMYHNYNLSTENSLYGQIPFCSFDLIRLGWIVPDEILEIRPDLTSQKLGVKLTDMRQQLTAQQKANGFCRIAKIYLKENYYGDKDEYLLIEFHKGTDYDRHFYNYDEGVGEGILVWHVVDHRSNNYNPAMDLLTAVPYNGFYGSPLPDDSYPETWEIYTYPDNFTGIYKNNEYDWLNDIYLGWSAYGTLTIAPNGGRHIYEVIEAHDPDYNWGRTNSKNDDFFKDNPIKGRVNDKITPVTRPSSRDWWGEHTNIGIVNMRHENDYMVIDVYNNYWAGNISQNETWADTIIVRGDISVEYGVTLTINPGTVVFFEDNKKINVYGTLMSMGSSSDNIKFTSINPSPSSNDWYGIMVYGNAVIDYSKIEYANRGIYFYNGATGSLSNCELSNSTYGAYLYKSKPVITNCEVYDCTTGIYLNSNNYISGDADIIDNDLNDCSTAIYCYKSSPEIRNNTITSCQNGTSCAFYGSPVFGAYYVSGDNIFTGCNRGIYAAYGSNPLLGQMYTGGWNQFISISSYFVEAYNSCNVKAEYNWWGSSPPNSNKFYAYTSSTIDYDPWLTSQPSKSLAKNSSSEEFYNSDYYDSWSIEQKLNYARECIYTGEIETADKICKEIIETYPDSTGSLFALDILWEASDSDNAKEGYDLAAFQSYLEELTNTNDKKELYGISKLILAGFDTKNNLALIENVYTEYNGTFVSEMALLQKFMHYYHEEENYDAAKNIMTQLDAEFPESQATAIAHYFFDNTTQYFAEKSQQNGNALNSTSNAQPAYALYNNYPNPFNPSTTIRYALPERAQVDLAVYDIQGRLIRRLVSGVRGAGQHEAPWDGRDANGRAAASGVYLYSLSTDQGFTQTRKLILLR